MLVSNNQITSCPRITIMGNPAMEKGIREAIDLSAIHASFCFQNVDCRNTTKLIAGYKNDSDVFITGMSIINTLNKLRKTTAAPIITVPIEIFDIISAIRKARESLKEEREIIIILHSVLIRKLRSCQSVLCNKIRQIGYTDVSEIENIVKGLSDKNNKVIIGSSFPCLNAEKFNIPNILVYSKSTFERTIEEAVYIASLRRKMITLHSLQYNAISDLSGIGIINCASSGIITFINRKGRSILNLNKDTTLPYNITDIIPDINTQLKKVRNKENSLNFVTSVNKKEILFSVTPVNVFGLPEEFVISFHEPEEVSQHEYGIDKKNIKCGFTSKYSFDDLIGDSTVFENTLRKARSFSKNDFTVLIYGETGTGKELLAHSIHSASDRRNGPFLSINCASLSPSLLESELFGYEKGAFTGSNKDGKAGLLELAHHGTLFIDEIGELPLNFQVKILRFLEEKEIIRIGGNKLISVDVRVIVATNRNLRDEVKNGNFRLDLYQRIATLSIKTIPLKDRREDIPLLLEHLIRKHNNRINDINKTLINYLIMRLEDYSWPGNIRELESFAINLVVLNSTEKLTIIRADDILNSLIFFDDPTGHCIKQKVEIEDIYEALSKTDDNKTEASRILGIGRTTLWRKLKEHEEGLLR